ncbi:MAG TPA: thermonuclease family protein [Anaerohalosphaeraceae bacterium]|nr:thermonuclease family protein [Anaerohalosphaeraceae bacterium]HPC64876.1 thermonuclease family protein [Anaerohalosphaeraceae bacterium]
MRRITRNVIAAAFLLIVVSSITLLDRQFGGAIRKTIRQAAYTQPDWQKYHGRQFTVVEVIDGDTLDIDIPDKEFTNTRIRLLGVDTPETKHPTIGVMYYGPEAYNFSKQTALGQRVTILLDTVGDQRDRYGRLLAYVVLPDGRVLNEEIVRLGFGYAHLGFPHTKYAAYEALMEQAMQSKTGLWAGVARDDLPKWLRQKRPELLRNSR